MAEALGRIECADWSEWDPAEYLREYYQDVELDERFLLQFLVETARAMPAAPLVLDFGCGPTVHRLFPLIPRVAEIHLADYLPANRVAIQEWLSGKEEAHDWSAFAAVTLRMEGNRAPTAECIRKRQEALRRRVTRILPGDAGNPDPLGPEQRRGYPLVTSHYCADSATDDHATWRRYMENIAGLVSPGGVFILSALGSSRRYRVGRHWFPGAQVTECDLVAFLEGAGFIDIVIRTRAVPDRDDQGYSSVIFARATKPAAGPGSPGRRSGANDPDR